VDLFNRAAPAVDPEGRMSFMEHLGELRTRIVWSLVAVLVGLGAAFPFSEKIMIYLARPITKTGQTLKFLAVTEAFWAQMKIALITGLFVASPVILWQVWRFVEPGLHRYEKKYAVPFILVGSLLFLGGGAFALFVVTPYAIQFLLTYSKPGVLEASITIGNHIDFILKFTLAFGAVFELPLAITLLARMGVVNAKMLARNRKYAILGAFVAAAVLTPTPDIFNQTLMAGPLIILYEVGIISARIFGRRPSAPPPAASPRTWSSPSPLKPTTSTETKSTSAPSWIASRRARPGASPVSSQAGAPPLSGSSMSGSANVNPSKRAVASPWSSRPSLTLPAAKL